MPGEEEEEEEEDDDDDDDDDDRKEKAKHPIKKPPKNHLKKTTKSTKEFPHPPSPFPPHHPLTGMNNAMFFEVVEKGKSLGTHFTHVWSRDGGVGG